MSIVPIKLSDQSALSIVRNCAQDSSKVFFSGHAKQRMIKHRITNIQVLDCLLKGIICESVHRDIGTGDWKLNLEHYTAGAHVRVTVAIKYKESGERILVVTTF
jgi:Domain of unknown function (DUF4258)